MTAFWLCLDRALFGLVGSGVGGGEGAEGRIPPHRPIKAVVNRIKDSKQFYIEAKYNGSSTG